MDAAAVTTLICSSRDSVIEDLQRELSALGAVPDVIRTRAEWPEIGSGVAFLDLADADQPVREARLAFDASVELVAVVDNESVERLIPALAAGCRDYVFYPINPAELRLSWRRYLAGRRGKRPYRAPGLSGRLDLAFPSSVGYVRDVVSEVVEACERLAFSGSRATLNLRVAIGEALANAILYGNREDPETKVTVSAEFCAGSATVTITDEGAGFDPSAIKDPTRPENRGRSHGRGLFLLRSLADEVSFSEKGNSVTLTLRG